MDLSTASSAYQQQLEMARTAGNDPLIESIYQEQLAEDLSKARRELEIAWLYLMTS